MSKGFRFRFLGMLLAACLAPAAPAANPPWPETSFTYIAEHQSLSEVLTRFARIFGLEAVLSNGVRAMRGPVGGKFTTANPSEFLNQLGATYGLSWFVYDGKLYINKSNERSSQALSPPGVSIANLKQALIQLGLFEPKFGWGELPDRGMVMVSGPPPYISLVSRAVSELPPLVAEQKIQMFKLRYAQVDDRTIYFRDREITTSGVATILRGLVSSEGPRSGTSIALTEMASPLRAITPLGEERSEKAASRTQPENGATPPPPASDGRTRPTIQADSRLNAVIIRDRPENMPIYRDLIAILDVPSQLIEIEAMIVDVNSSAVNELGFDWQFRNNRVAGSFGNPASDPGAAASLAIGSGINPGTMVSSATSYLLSRIRALESQGNARIVSRPSILTLDNLGALIDLSDTFYIQSIGERVTSVVPISVGVTLRVTPRIIQEGIYKSVQLTVDIEDGVIQDSTTQSSLPRVRRSTIGTQAVMGEQESMLIGGFNSEQDVNQSDGVPVLSSIPVLGMLFRNNTASYGKRERLFLLTPRIVAPDMRRTEPARYLPSGQAGPGLDTARPAPDPIPREREQISAQPHLRQETLMERQIPVPQPSGLRLDPGLPVAPNP